MDRLTLRLKVLHARKLLKHQFRL